MQKKVFLCILLDSKKRFTQWAKFQDCPSLPLMPFHPPFAINTSHLTLYFILQTSTFSIAHSNLHQNEVLFCHFCHRLLLFYSFNLRRCDRAYFTNKYLGLHDLQPDTSQVKLCVIERIHCQSLDLHCECN